MTMCHHYDRSIMEWIRQCRYGITVLLRGGARPICQPISESNRRNIMAIFLFIITSRTSSENEKRSHDIKNDIQKTQLLLP